MYKIWRQQYREALGYCSNELSDLQGGNRNGMKFEITKGKFLHCGINRKIFLIYVGALQRR